MANLAQRFIWIELACGNSRTLAHTTEQTGRIDEIRPPRPDERGYVVAARDWLSAESITLVLGVAIGLAFVASFVLFRGTQLNGTIDKAVTKALVERIIIAESNGDANARNKRSSATGAAQFVDDTWLEAIRRHRRDLMAGRSKKERDGLRRQPVPRRDNVPTLVGARRSDFVGMDCLLGRMREEPRVAVGQIGAEQPLGEVWHRAERSNARNSHPISLPKETLQTSNKAA